MVIGFDCDYEDLIDIVSTQIRVDTTIIFSKFECIQSDKKDQFQRGLKNNV